MDFFHHMQEVSAITLINANRSYVLQRLPALMDSNFFFLVEPLLLWIVGWVTGFFFCSPLAQLPPIIF